jgi:putative ABC transport system permease protein
VLIVNGFTQDLRHSARLLRSNPGFSAVAVLALALGIGANASVFTVVNGVLLRPLPFPDPDRLVLVAEAARGAVATPWHRLSDRDYLALRQSDRLLDALATFEARGADLAGAGDPVHLRAGAVTADFFRALGVRPAIGRGFTAADETAPVAVIGASLWRERFAADPKIVGATVHIDGVPHTIIGVMPAGFAYPDDAQLWTPLVVRADPHMGFYRPVVGRLSAGVSAGEVGAELQPLLPKGRVAVIEPFQELMVADVRRPLLIFDAAVGFVLLIACANVANLMLIRTSARAKEMAVRGAIGATTGRLARQLFTESALLAACGGAAGLLIATWGVPLLLSLAPEGAIPRLSDIHIDAGVLAFTAAVTALTAILFGLAPLPYVVGGRLRDSLATGPRVGGPRRTRLRSALAVAELAFALVLLAGGGLMLKSSLRILSVDSGYRPENLLAMTIELPDAVYRTPGARLAFETKLLEKLSAVGGVTVAGAADFTPLSAHLLEGDISVEPGARVPEGYLVEKVSASPGYFGALAIRLLGGRDFTPGDSNLSPRVAVVSQSVAHELWPGQNPIGKRLSTETRPKAEDWLTVVGVVGDVRQFGPATPPVRAVYRPIAQSDLSAGELTFVARTAIDPALIAPTILRRAVADVERNQAIASLTTMQDLLSQSVAEPLFQTRVLAAFAVMALLLAAVGIYGVVAYSVSERTREIGIRIALGAGRRDVLREVLTSALRIAAAGVVLGSAGAFAATRTLSRLLFEVKPGDPAVFAAVATLLVAVAVAAGLIPARRATQVDPVVALRYE